MPAHPAALAEEEGSMSVQAREKPDLSQLLTLLDELRRTERRATSARMVSVAGHLIGTPLNVIAGRAALIRSNPAPEAVEENVRRIEEQVERLALRIRRLIDYFGLQEPAGLERGVADVLDECLALYRPVAELKGVDVEVSAPVVDAMRVDSSVVSLVLTTLLSLAIRTTQKGQTVRLALNERGPKALAFELTMPGLDAPVSRFDRLEPPEHGERYDAGALEAFWVCLGLARRIGGGLEVTKATSGTGVVVRFDCAYV
jgi:two-component system, NtrC family, sensor kinase